MGNTFGTLFRLTSFGESHGAAVGAVIDGCPAGLELSEADIQPQLDRRRPGQSALTTARDEADAVKILSGVEKGITLGSPIALVVWNQDARPSDYAPAQSAPRPSHADYTYRAKYGVAASSGGGRASARETVARVAGGAVAEKFLMARYGIVITAWVSAVENVQAPDLTDAGITRQLVDAAPVRCPHAESAELMARAIARARDEGDSVGGVITCVCRGVPPGWGEPVFDKLTALLAHAMMSLPATRGVEFGAGFAAARMRGSAHNDAFVAGNGRLRTATNRSGGIQGGISNGEPIVFRVAFKPAATIRKAQKSADYEGHEVMIEGAGRHDPCVVPRAVPVVEAMAALVLADAALMAEAYGAGR